MELAWSLLGLAEIAQTLAEDGLVLQGLVLTLDEFDVFADVLGEDQLLAFLGFEEHVEDLFRRSIF